MLVIGRARTVTYLPCLYAISLVMQTQVCDDCSVAASSPGLRPVRSRGEDVPEPFLDIVDAVVVSEYIAAIAADGVNDIGSHRGRLDGADGVHRSLDPPGHDSAKGHKFGV
jgi:hypothetical protein